MGPGTNSGHGHVWLRPDGLKARCGGPKHCSNCEEDYQKVYGKIKKMYDATVEDSYDSKGRRNTGTGWPEKDK